MLHFYSGHSDAVNPKKAIMEALSMATHIIKDTVKLVIIHSSSGYEHQKLLKTIYDELGDVLIIGTTGCGVVSNNFVSETIRSLALTVVTGDDFIVVKKDGLTVENSYKLANESAIEIKKQNKNIPILMAFAPGFPVNAEELLKGISDIFTHQIPILGGLAGFNGEDSEKMFLFYNQEILTNSLILLAITDPTLSAIQSSHHGHVPYPLANFKVTKAHDNVIEEIDNRPAWHVLMDSIEMPYETQPIDILVTMALGIKLDEENQKDYDNQYLLKVPLIIDEDGKSIILQTIVEEGTTLVSCHVDEDYLMKGVDKLNSRLKSKYNSQKPIAVFQTDCIARGRMSNGVVRKEEIIRNMQEGIIGNKDISWLGFYSFGEFASLNGQNCYHNYTSSISILLR